MNETEGFIISVSSWLNLCFSVLKALVERESAHRLAQQGGSEPDLQMISRRQSNT